MKSDCMTLPVRPEVVWLDLDDTLIDFHANSRVALGLLYREQKLDRWIPTENQWIDDYERNNIALWRQYAEGSVARDYLRIERMRAPLRPFWSDSAEALDSFAMQLDPLYLDLLAQQRKLIPGALPLLKSLKERGYKIGILSNGFKQVQFRKMESAGLSELIDVVVLSDDIGVNKPSLDIYRHAMHLTGVTNPGRHLMVGDNLDTDIAGAVNAGWEAIYFNPELGSRIEHTPTHFTTGRLAKVDKIIP